MCFLINNRGKTEPTKPTPHFSDFPSTFRPRWAHLDDPLRLKKKFVVGQHHESVWLRQADGETRTLTPQQMERTEGSNPSLSSQTLSTSWESICFTRRGSAIETRHHPPTCATDFESPVYTNFITLAFKVITPYGIPLKYY